MKKPVFLSLLYFLIKLGLFITVSFLQPGCCKENEKDKPQITPVFSEMTDPRDGRVYKTVRLGIMTWFAENLAYLPQVDTPQPVSDNDERYYVYGCSEQSVEKAKDFENYLVYGVLYNWSAATNSCPAGWNLPSVTNWETLIDDLGKLAGYKMKSDSIWSSSLRGDNSSGLNILPGGSFSPYSGFGGLRDRAFFWTSTTPNYTDFQQWERNYVSIKELVIIDYNYLPSGFSVRCVKWGYSGD